MSDPKSEFALIDWIAKQGRTADARVVVGIGDDMAVLESGGRKVLITTDLLLEGTHFDLAWASLEQVGYKAMACSLSDCAAMASVPLAAVVTVSLPRHFSLAQAQELHAGLCRAAEKYHCPLVGGDTTSWPGPLTVGVTMLATEDGVRPVLRSGARPGDVIVVTGRLGGSIHGKHLVFEPRLAEARFLACHADLHALMDISDGLAGDLRHICVQSGVSAVLDLAAVPISPAARQQADPLKAAMTDGEDFELVACMTRGDYERLLSDWNKQFELPLTAVGEIVGLDAGPSGQPSLWCDDKEGRRHELLWHGWEHFCDES